MQNKLGNAQTKIWTEIKSSLEVVGGKRGRGWGNWVMDLKGGT